MGHQHTRADGYANARPRRPQKSPERSDPSGGEGTTPSKDVLRIAALTPGGLGLCVAERIKRHSPLREKARFVAALLALKANGTYDQYVLLHVNNMPAAHQGPAFFPWHREMLRRLELDLQAIDASVTLPYWNWTVDNSATSTLWNDDLMGGNGRPSDGKVMTGPFAFDAGNWPLAGGPVFLARRLAQSTLSPTLPTTTDLANALTTTPYDLAPFNSSSSLAGFRNTFEGWRNGPQLHNRVHVWIGGSMGPTSSPNDPVFFLHHCFIDKCWADWQALNPGEAAFLPLTGAANGHNSTDPMEPWAGQGTVVTPASVIDHHALGYAYDTEGHLSADDQVP